MYTVPSVSTCEVGNFERKKKYNHCSNKIMISCQSDVCYVTKFMNTLWQNRKTCFFFSSKYPTPPQLVRAHVVSRLYNIGDVSAFFLTVTLIYFLDKFVLNITLRCLYSCFVLSITILNFVYRYFREKHITLLYLLQIAGEIYLIT
jgi:hypothetical protein